MKLNENELILIRDALGQFLLDGFVKTAEEFELLESLLCKIKYELTSDRVTSDEIKVVISALDYFTVDGIASEELPVVASLEYKLWRGLGDAETRESE